MLTRDRALVGPQQPAFGEARQPVDPRHRNVRRVPLPAIMAASWLGASRCNPAVGLSAISEYHQPRLDHSSHEGEQARSSGVPDPAQSDPAEALWCKRFDDDHHNRLVDYPYSAGKQSRPASGASPGCGCRLLHWGTSPGTMSNCRIVGADRLGPPIQLLEWRDSSSRLGIEASGGSSFSLPSSVRARLRCGARHLSTSSVRAG